MYLTAALKYRQNIVTLRKESRVSRFDVGAMLMLYIIFRKISAYTYIFFKYCICDIEFFLINNYLMTSKKFKEIFFLIISA